MVTSRRWLVAGPDGLSVVAVRDQHNGIHDSWFGGLCRSEFRSRRVLNSPTGRCLPGKTPTDGPSSRPERLKNSPAIVQKNARIDDVPVAGAGMGEVVESGQLYKPDEDEHDPGGLGSSVATTY